MGERADHRSHVCVHNGRSYPIGISQIAQITLQIKPAPPTITDNFRQISFILIRPDGTIINNTYSFIPASTGFAFNYLPPPEQPSTQKQGNWTPGNWTLKISFPGQSYSNNSIYYLPSQNQTTLTVNPSPTPPPPIIAGYWTQKAPMPTARWGLGVAVVNGEIYAIGGTDNANTAAIETNQMYNPATDTWTTKAAMPTPRSNFATAVYGGKIYCIGGGNAHGVTGVNQVYDPATDTWTTKAAMPTPQSCITANLVNGKIYIISNGLNQVYDPASDTWTTKTPPPTSTLFSASAVVNGKIYTTGGANSGGEYAGAAAVSLTQVYDPETDTWTAGASIPQNFALAVGTGTAQATTGVLAPKMVVVIGGGDDLDWYPLVPSNAVQVYFPENNSWRRGADMPTSREMVGVAVVNDVFYAIGGGHPPGNTASDANEQYTPPGYGTPDPTYQTPTPSTTPTSSPSPLQTPTLTPTPTPSPTPSSSIPEFPSWILLAFLVASTLLITYKRKGIER